MAWAKPLRFVILVRPIDYLVWSILIGLFLVVKHRGLSNTACMAIEALYGDLRL